MAVGIYVCVCVCVNRRRCLTSIGLPPAVTLLLDTCLWLATFARPIDDDSGDSLQNCGIGSGPTRGTSVSHS